VRIIEPGAYTLVVDFGRRRHRGLGVPVGGAADRASLALGNALVGNAPDAAALEFALSGPTVRNKVPLACVVFGAAFEIGKDGKKGAVGKTFTLFPGEVLRIGTSPTGMRGYLCVQGGIQAPLILGSRSALAPVRKGEELACSTGRIHARFLSAEAAESLRLPFPFGTGGAGQGSENPLDVVDGLQADWFDSDAFYGQSFTVMPASNRMGLRLQGEPLVRPERELVSEPVCPGAVQVTHDGQCIILGVDGQTIGGYPKIAQVISADLDRLGQLRPGDRIRFARVSLEEALARYRACQAALQGCVRRLRVSLDGLRIRTEV
jgi:antagonist of KipI